MGTNMGLKQSENYQGKGAGPSSRNKRRAPGRAAAPVVDLGDVERLTEEKCDGL